MEQYQIITVVVTADDIKKGKACKSECCPIALALFRRTKHKWSVGPRCASSLSGFGKFINLPQSAQVFITKFDKKGAKAVKPFRFKTEQWF
jgi:hypothetical protein